MYYKGEKLTVEQMEAKRHALRYQVQIKETHKTFDQVSGKDEAETAAKTEAIKGALRNAAKKNGIELTEDDLKDIKLTGGDLVVTRDGKKYTFHYTEADVKYSTPTSTDDTTVDSKDAEDVKETTVTGTAYVTRGTISWSKQDEKGNYTASGTLKPGDNHIASKPAKPTGDNVTFTQEGDAAVYTVTTKNDDGSITETIYTFREAVVSPLVLPRRDRPPGKLSPPPLANPLISCRPRATPSVTSSLILSPNPPGPWRPGPARPRQRTPPSTNLW